MPILNLEKENNKGEKLSVEVDFNKEMVEKAISVGWESLYFPSNDISFAKVQFDEEFIFVLSTEGDVSIEVPLSEDSEFLYNEDEEEILHLLKDNKVEDLLLVNNNWFTVYICKKNTGETINPYIMIGSYLYEDEPKSIDEFIESIVDYSIWLKEEFK